MATITKRNNTYKITVSCGRTSNGKQIRRYLTYTPEQGLTERQIEKEVQRKAVLFEEQCRNGQAAADGRIKLDEYIPMYLQNAKMTLSPQVLKNYTSALNRYVIPTLGHLRLKDIKPLHIQQFINQLQELDNQRTKSGKLSPSTIHRYYTALQSVMHSAYRLGIIPFNPADSDRITLPKQEEQTTEIFTEQEIKQIMQRLESEPLQFKVLIHLALNTGCRRGELVGLKWSDVDFNTGVITVQRSNYKLTGEPIKSKVPKTGHTRRVTIPPHCVKLLRTYRAEQAQYRFSIGDKWQGDNWIFIQADGAPMYPSTPTMMFDKFLKRHNLKHRKFHALRHTSATLLLSNGTNIKNVASRLGHSQLKTTDRYVHAVEQADIEAANTFETMFYSSERLA